MISPRCVYGLVLSFWRLSAIPLRRSLAIKVGILRRSAGPERLSTKAISDGGLFTTGLLTSFRNLFNSLILLIGLYKNRLKMRDFIPSYTIKIFFPANSFSQCRRSKSSWDHTICDDLFPSGDLLQAVLKTHFFLMVVLWGAGGLLFLCSGGASLTNGLHSPVLL